MYCCPSSGVCVAVDTKAGAAEAFTVSMSVLMLGGSKSRDTDSTNTKKAITIRNRPLMKPDRISTRPYLRAGKGGGAGLTKQYGRESCTLFFFRSFKSLAVVIAF